ncbi:MAG: hypothetical protein ACRDGM_12040 [bacterium]
MVQGHEDQADQQPNDDPAWHARQISHRLATALGLLGTAASLSLVIGGYWDGWWHFNIGRDTFWTRPHLLMYAEVVTALAVGALGFLDSRLRPAAIVIGLGGLFSIVAAPIDNLWHAVFGIDFTIWSPPHIIGIVAGGAVSGIGLLAWWMVEERTTPGHWAKRLARAALAVQVAALIPWLLFILMEYEQTLVMRRSILAYRWDLQAAYYPVFVAYLAFSTAVAVARAIGPAVLAAGSVIGYLLLLSLSWVLQGEAPMAFPVPLFLALIVIAVITMWMFGLAGDITACLAAVPVLYLGMTLGGRPVPHHFESITGTAAAAVAAAVAGRLLGLALVEVGHADA